MTIKHQIQCDGCDMTDLIAPGALSDKIRSGILISYGGGADKVYDLCVNCDAHLTRQIDPKSWPRVEREG